MNRKLRSVIRHEYFTIVKQPAFILTMLAVPLIMVAVGAITFFSERTAMSSIEDAASDLESIVIVDESGLINRDIVASLEFEFKEADARDEAIQQVQAQEIKGAIIYPDDLLESRRFDVYLDGGNDFIASSALTDIGQQLLESSLLAQIEDPNLALLIQSGGQSNVTTFLDGEETAGAGEYIVPGAFLLIFFIILFFTMGYMLLGVAEEKENRSMEMVLSYVRPRTLMSGKLFGIGLVALTQLLFFMLLGLLTYFTARNYQELVAIPFDIDFSGLVFDPVAIIIGISVLMLGFLLFAAFMSGVAAMAPGVKEANSFSSIFFLLPFVPFWSLQVVLAAPESFIVRFLSFFPLTAPTTLLLRNTVGNLSQLEAALAILTLAVFTVLFFMLAAKLFRLGALEFSDRVKLSALFKK